MRPLHSRTVDVPGSVRGGAFGLALAVSLLTAGPAVAAIKSQTFTATGAASFVVPSGLERVRIEAVGGSGGQGCGFSAGFGGQGAYVAGTVAVTAGDELRVFVGGVGTRPQCAIGTGTGGAGGGGTGTATLLPGGGGGGASSVATGSAFPAGTPLVVAGGGGGAGGANTSGAGGDAGADGSPGCETTAGEAGKANGGGAGGSQLSPGASGSYGQGGSGGASSGSAGGGGGGGGLYGGGGGGGHTATSGVVCGSGGGGGSSFLTAGAEDASGPTPTPAAPGVRVSWTNRPPGDPGAPRLQSAATPRANGAFMVAWDPAADLDGDAITYALERRDGDDGSWTAVASGLSATSYAFGGSSGNAALGEGTWDFRVRASDGLEASAPAASEDLVVVDATPPAAPVLEAATAGQSPSADVGGVTWYRDSVLVAFAASDPPLADGTAGSGVDPATTSSFSVTTNGTSGHTRTVADRAGNISNVSESFTARVDAADPSAAITDCPTQPVAVGAALTLNWQASDGESGLSTPAAGTVPVDTSSPGVVQVAAPAPFDNVGHTAVGGTCDVTVRAKPANTKRPSARASAWNPGEIATAGTGNWDGDPTRYDYAWHRCTGATVPCTKIADADGSTYTLTSADEGHRLRVYVTAHNDVGSTTRYSTPGPVVGIPVRTGGPSVSGRILAGDTLTVDTGQWSPAATGYDVVEWLRCSTLAHSSCTPVGSADATDGDTTYTLVDADTAARMRARVVARNAAGSSRPALSTASDAVNAPTNTRRPKVTGTPQLGAVLTTSTGQWTGVPTRYDVEWLRCGTVAFSSCRVIGGESGGTYTVADADEGRLLRSRVRAHNANGAGRSAYSVVTPPLPRAPRGPGR